MRRRNGTVLTTLLSQMKVIRHIRIAWIIAIATSRVLAADPDKGTRAPLPIVFEHRDGKGAVQVDDSKLFAFEQKERRRLGEPDGARRGVFVGRFVLVRFSLWPDRRRLVRSAGTDCSGGQRRDRHSAINSGLWKTTLGTTSERRRSAGDSTIDQGERLSRQFACGSNRNGRLRRPRKKSLSTEQSISIFISRRRAGAASGLTIPPNN